MATATKRICLVICCGVLLVCCCAQPDAELVEATDSRGREFVVGFMRQFGGRQDGNLTLYLTSSKPTQAVLSAHQFEAKRNLTPGLVETIFMPQKLIMEKGLEDKGILVTADEEISVYVLNQLSSSTDAYLALPTDSNGYEYYVASYSSQILQTRSLFAVIGIEDKTRVKVTPSAPIEMPDGTILKPGKTTKVRLNRLQTFLFESKPNGDLTGTRIESKKPIAVLSGHECANVPAYVTFCDHLVEQLPPISRWGTEYVTAPFSRRKAGDLFRIIASQDNTIIKLNNKEKAVKDAGEYLEVSLSSTSYNYVTTTEPSLLVQYCKSTGADQQPTDPFMMLVPPTSQYASAYTIATPAAIPVNFSSYMTVIVAKNETAGIRLDGQPFQNGVEWHKVVASSSRSYAVSTIPLATGSHSVRHVSPIIQFAVMLYGYASYDSYGYPGGLRLSDVLVCFPDRIAQPGDNIDNDCDGRIDEELRNYRDDDRDGITDEDLATFPPEIKIPQNATVFNCSSAMDLDFLGRASVVSAADSCYPVSLKFSDAMEQTGCRRYIRRMWLGTDACGNMDKGTQEIIIDDQVPPHVKAPPHTTATCETLNKMAVVGVASASDDCDRKKSIKTTFSDAQAGCIVIRTWESKDICGNAAKPVIQNISVYLDQPSVKIPANWELRCNQSTYPSVTGYLEITSGPKLCGAMKDLSIKVDYFDEETTRSDCRMTITRKWRVTNVCGSTWSYPQRILVIANRAPVVRFPPNAHVPCFHIYNLAVTGQPYVFGNCSPVQVTHTDRVFSCGMERTWTVRDYCGYEVVRHIQIISLKYEFPVLDHPLNTTISCSDSLLDVPSFSDIRLACGDILVRINDVRVVENWTGNACERRLNRHLILTDTCNEVVHHDYTITIIDDTLPHLKRAPFNTSATCAQAVNFSYVGEPVVTDTCTVGRAVPEDQLKGHKLARKWVYEDTCGNRGGHTIQTIDIEEPAPVVVAPRNVTVLCNESIHPDDVGYAVIQKDIDDNCYHFYSGKSKLKSKTSLVYNDQSDRDDCPRTITRIWTYDTFLGHSVTQVQFIFQEIPCVRDGAFPGDNLDNDCDGRIDEEIKNYVDDDGDGRTDEDLAYRPPKIEVYISMAIKGCGISTAVDDNPKVSLDSRCKLVSREFTDFNNGDDCPRVFRRVWNVSDDCGNIVRKTQTFEVSQGDPPRLTAPSDTVAPCDNYRDTNVTGKAVVTGGCEGLSTLSAEFVDATSGCTVLRTWHASDSCGNVASHVVQKIKIKIQAPFVDPPEDVSLTCRHRLAPHFTGRPSVRKQPLCDTGAFLPRKVVTYVDSLKTLNVCQTKVTRRWTISDVCGNSVLVTQHIVVSEPRSPSVVFPDDTKAVCSDIFNLDVTGRPQVTSNCSEVRVKYKDEVRSCHVERTWTVETRCGEYQANKTQVIRLEYEPFPIEPFPDLILSCEQRGRYPAFKQPVHRLDCSGMTVTGLTVNFTDVSEEGTSCLSVVHRQANVSDSCGNVRLFSYSLTYQDVTAPVVVAPSDENATCSQAVALSERKVLEVGDTCSDVILKYKQNVQRNILVKTWKANDTCNNRSPSVTQRLVLHDREIKADFPADSVVPCNGSIRPENTGFPVLVRNMSIACYLLGVEEPSIDYVDIVDGLECPFVVLRIWTVSTVLGQLLDQTQRIEVEAPPCRVSKMIPADGVDNDCDDRVDEEVRDFTDNDGDGIIDEDLIVEPMVVAYPPDYNVSSCSASVEADLLGTPQVSGVAAKCQPFTATHNDKVLVGRCRRDIVRQWLVIDSCGNLARGTQTITINDKTPPVLFVRQLVRVTCLQLNDTSITGRPMVRDDCQKGNISVWFQDEVNGCSFERRWFADDGCGGRSSVVQTIVPILETGQVPLPDNKILSCGESPLPKNTGTPVAYPRQLCSSKHILPVITSYSDSQEVVSACRSVFERTWLFGDVCGSFPSFKQQITMKRQSRPLVTFPSDLLVSCQDIQDPIETSAPHIAQNCVDVKVTFADTVGDCHVRRNWSITDECGRLVRSQNQIIRVKHSNQMRLPSIITVGCNKKVELPSFNATEQPTVCHGIAVPPHNITSFDVLVSGDPCRREVTRTVRINGNCADKKVLRQTIVQEDRDPPRLGVSSDIEASCELAHNVELVGAAVAHDDCNNVAVNHSDRLHGSTLVRTWSAVDSCGNAASELTQRISLVELAPRVVYPSDRVQECGLSYFPNATGWPRIDQDISPTCFTLGGAPTTITYDDTVSGVECNQTIRRTWRIATFLGHYLTYIQTINIIPRPCRATTGEPMDGVDNDCDDRIDEEAKNSIDDDGDGRIDEDLATVPVRILPSEEFPVSTTCRAVTDSDSIVRPSYNVTDDCRPVSLMYEDVASMGNSACRKSIIRKWNASDACGNTDTSEQLIQIVDRTAPDVDFASVVDMSCGDVDVGTSNGIAYDDDCSGGGVNVTCSYAYHVNYTVDEFYGCIARRECVVQDECGNRGLPFQQTIRLNAKSLEDFSVKFPDDVLTCGVASTDPEMTGRPISTGYAVCKSNIRADPEIEYSDMVVSIEGCRDVVNRRWVVRDVCGQGVESRTQMISVVRDLASAVMFPGNTTVTCGDSIHPDWTSWPVVRKNCSDIRFVYSDSVLRCFVIRSWKAFDVCGNVVATAVQGIGVSHGYSHLRYQKTLYRSCDEDASKTYPHIDNISCHGVVIQGPFVSFSLSDEGGDTCRRIAHRNVTVSSSCGVLRRHTQTIHYSDRTPPSLHYLPHVNISCSDAVNLPVAGRPFANDSCSSLNVTFEDRLFESYIERKWSARDGCGNSAKPQVQRIGLLDHDLTLSPIENRSVYCNESTRPEHTGRPAVTQDVSQSCQNLGIKEAAVTYEDSVEGLACPRKIRRKWTVVSALGSHQTIQVIKQVPRPLRITVPSDVLQHDCLAGIDPAVTGRSVVSFVSDFCTPTGPPHYYNGVDRSQSSCTTVLTRHWVANDSCGNVDSTTQRIEVVDTTPPAIRAPANVVASCGNYQNATYLGFPTTSDDCSRVSTTYSDELLGCRVTRTWHARDECGNDATSVTQVIELRPGMPDVYIPGNVNVTCDDSLSPSTTGVPLVIESRLCSWNATAAVTVDHADTSREHENCQTIIKRRWSVTDICGSSFIGFQTIIVLHKAPSIEIPVDTVVSCRLSSDLAITGEANVTSSCRRTLAYHSDSLNGSVLLRSWSASDECSRVAAPQAQRISLLEDPPVLLVPSNLTMECKDDFHPNHTGWARLERDVDGSCFELGGAATVVSYVDVAARGKCPGFILRRWTASTFLGHVVEGEQWITLGCDLSSTVPEDGKDNDCDGEVDEELRNFIDDDGDGVIDEDLSTIPPQLQPPSPVSLTSCHDSTDPRHTGYPTILVSSQSCNTTTLTHDDNVARETCKQHISRKWTVVDSCGNIDTAIQTIVIEDHTSPNLTAPSSRSVTCSQYRNMTADGAGSALSRDDCASEPTVSYTDQLRGCIVWRMWSARDECGNMANSEIQTLRLGGPAMSVDFPNDMSVSCMSNTDFEVTGFPGVSRPDLCDWNVTNAVSVTHTNTTMELENCNVRIARNWRVSDVCGRELNHTQNITVLHQPPVITAPENTTSNCDGVGNLDLVGRAIVERSCKTVNVTYDDELDGTALTRRWKGTDSCGVSASPQIQHIRIREDPPQLILPRNATISCHASSHPNSTGWAHLERDLSPSCFRLRGFHAATVVDYVDDTMGFGCPRHILRQWRATTFLGNSFYANQLITLISCNVSETVPEDGKDNDCDAKVDEEARNFIDDDGDGLIDEDLVTIPVKLVALPPVYLTSCRNSTGPQHTGRPGVSIVSKRCRPVAITNSDKTVVKTCRREIQREWVATDSCGNVDIIKQSIVVNDGTAPSLSAPTSRTITCRQYKNASLTGTAVSRDDCDGAVSTWYEDEFRQCVVLRTWRARDDCGNTAKAQTQELALRIDPPTVRFPGDVSVTCETNMTPRETGQPNVNNLDLCGQDTIDIISVSHDDTETRSGKCKQAISRTWRVSPICGNEISHVQNILTTQDNNLRARGLRTASVWYITTLISISISYFLFTS